MPAVTAAAVAKAAAAILSDGRARKAVGWIIAAILSPLIILIILICGFMSGGSQHNIAAVDLCYYGGAISGTVPEAYRKHIKNMQDSFALIDNSIASINAMTENGNGIDSHRVKAIFYSLFFDAENPTEVGITQFVDCFVTYEEHTYSWADEFEVVHEETYMVAVLVPSLDTVYANITSVMGVDITDAVKKNADALYNRTLSGGDIFSGKYTRGDDPCLELDVSAFVNPEIKNNLDLVTYVTYTWNSCWGYVWGTYGSVLSDSLFDYMLEQYPEGVGNYEDFIRTNWLGRRTADCVGLIKGYGWLNPETLTIEYGTNDMPDIGANAMYENATEKGNISTMPEVPGLAVWHSGHIGVYIGNGEVIEAMGTKYGVVKTKLADRSWTAWLEIPYITYCTTEE